MGLFGAPFSLANRWAGELTTAGRRPGRAKTEKIGADRWRGEPLCGDPESPITPSFLADISTRGRWRDTLSGWPAPCLIRAAARAEAIFASSTQAISDEAMPAALDLDDFSPRKDPVAQGLFLS